MLASSTFTTTTAAAIVTLPVSVTWRNKREVAREGVVHFGDEPVIEPAVGGLVRVGSQGKHQDARHLQVQSVHGPDAAALFV